LLPGWSHRYKNSTIVITIWLTVTKYPYLKWQWILCFLRRCLYPLSLPRFYHSWLYIWVTRWVSYKKKELLTFREHTWVHPRFLGVFSVLLIFFSFFFFFPSLCLSVLSSNIGYSRRRKTKQKHNTICGGHHYAQTNTNNVNNTCALLQTTGGKDEPNIVFMRKS
jgi:hypothetical protein